MVACSVADIIRDAQRQNVHREKNRMRITRYIAMLKAMLQELHRGMVIMGNEKPAETMISAGRGGSMEDGEVKSAKQGYEQRRGGRV